jgi:hypothetical protein
MVLFKKFLKNKLPHFILEAHTVLLNYMAFGLQKTIEKAMECLPVMEFCLIMKVR